jgi:hypothetical protein
MLLEWLYVAKHFPAHAAGAGSVARFLHSSGTDDRIRGLARFRDMKTPALLVLLTAGMLTLTGCESTVVERHHGYRPSGYYAGERYYGGQRYYGNRYYGSRYSSSRYSSSRYSGNRYYDGRYAGRSAVVVSSPTYRRGGVVYTSSTPRYRSSHVATRSGYRYYRD